METDIEFTTTVTWFIGAPFPTMLPTVTSFRQTALHELGHALGLSLLNVHQNGYPTTMNAGYPFGGNAEGIPGFGSFRIAPDDRAGDVFLYSNAQLDSTDLQVVPFVWDAATGASQLNLFGQMNPQNTANSTSNCFVPGDSFRAFYSLQNLSNQSYEAYFNIRVGFYVSTDNSITPADTLIGTYFWTGGPGPYAHADNSSGKTGVVPTWLSTGTYFFGVIVDDTNVIFPEFSDANNSGRLVNQMIVKGSCP